MNLAGNGQSPSLVLCPCDGIIWKQGRARLSLFQIANDGTRLTQYLAIVWTYNRNLAQKPEKTRPRFTRIFARGGVAVAGFYVALCLVYGLLLTDEIWLPIVSQFADEL